MSDNHFTYNDLMYSVQEWPYPEAKELSYSDLRKWYDKEGYKGKSFIFSRTKENHKAAEAYNMGYALAWGFGSYCGTMLAFIFLFLWLGLKIFKLLS